MNSNLHRDQFESLSGRWVRRWRRHQRADCVNVITYHRVAARECPFTRDRGLTHHPVEFERHLDYLTAYYRVISLREMLGASQRGETLERCVVLTFDDGYADSLYTVVPIMQRRRLPLSIFPVTGVIGNTDLLWMDKLAWLIENGHADRMFDAAGAGRPDGRSVADYLRHEFSPRTPALIEEVLRSVGESGRGLAGRHRPYMEPEDIQKCSDELIAFENHTHTHPILSALSPEAQAREMAVARDVIRDLTGSAPIALAYPFGLKRHYDESSKAAARETGHRCVLDQRRRANRPSLDPFEISRKPAPQGSQLLFEKMIEDWPESVASTVETTRA